MSIYQPRPMRLHWDAENGWLIDVPTTLTNEQLGRIVKWALPRQIDRWRSLPHGEKREQLAGAIKDLQAGKIHQCLLDTEGDGTLVPFASTERVKPTAYFFGAEENKNG